MRGKILKTFLTASALCCISISVPLKTNALPKSDVDTTINYCDAFSKEQSETGSYSVMYAQSSDISSDLNSAQEEKKYTISDSNTVTSNDTSPVSILENQYVSNKTLTVNEAKDVIMNADGDYINKILVSKKNAVLNYDREIQMMNIKQFYNIIDEPCYVFSLTYDYSDLFTAADAIYYVGKNSRRVYVINGTDAQAYAYEMNYNRKVNSFIYKGSDNCMQWHN